MDTIAKTPAQQHRQGYRDEDAKNIVDWLNRKFLGVPVGLLGDTKDKCPPQVIRHNHPIGQRTKWAASFTGSYGIFGHLDGPRMAVRGSNEGWTPEDVRSFADYLASRL